MHKPLYMTIGFVVFFAAAIFNFVSGDSDTQEKSDEKLTIHYETSLEKKEIVELPQSTTNVNIKTVEENNTEWVRDIPLNKDLQKYIYQKSAEFNFDYDLILSIIWKESTYRADVFSETNDTGLMQINNRNQEWVNEMAGRPLDLLNPYENVLAGLLILDYNRAYWENKNISEDEILIYMLNGYNMGNVGYAKAGYPRRDYDKKIIKKMHELQNENIDLVS